MALATILVLGVHSPAALATASYGYDGQVYSYDVVLNKVTQPASFVGASAEVLIDTVDIDQISDTPDCSYATNTADDVLRLSTEESWGNLNTLDDHFLRHGADFGATSADDYAAQASEFFQRAQHQGLPTKIDTSGVIRIYDPATNTFGAYNATGTTRTFFTPKRGIDYWLDQPGVAPWSPGS